MQVHYEDSDPWWVRPEPFLPLLPIGIVLLIFWALMM